MFYTITFSPSIDLLIETDNQFDRNGLTRYENSDLLAGGKGINASVILNRLGFETTAITFMNGAISNMITEQLEKEKVKLIAIPSVNETRINIKFNNQINNFELNGPASIIDAKAENQLMKLISSMTGNDVVFIMGRSNMTLVESIVKILSANNVKFVLDIDSKEIMKLLKYKPFVIKPNIFELATLMEVKIKTEKDIIKHGNKLIQMGLQNLLVSCADEGSYFMNKEKILKIETPKLKIINSSGAGDSMLATFVAKYVESNNVEKSFILSNAAGMATVSSKWLGTLEMIEDIKDSLKIIKI